MDDQTHQALHEYVGKHTPHLGKTVAKLVSAVLDPELGIVGIGGVLDGRQIITVCRVEAINTEKAAMTPLLIFIPDLESAEVELPPCMDTVRGMQAQVTLAEIKHPEVNN